MFAEALISHLFLAENMNTMADADIVRVAHRLAVTLGEGSLEDTGEGKRRTIYRLIEPGILHGLSIEVDWNSSSQRLYAGFGVRIFDHHPVDSKEGSLVFEALYASARAGVIAGLKVLKKELDEKKNGWLLRMAVVVAAPEAALDSVSRVQLVRQNKARVEGLERKRLEYEYSSRR